MTLHDDARQALDALAAGGVAALGRLLRRAEEEPAFADALGRLLGPRHGTTRRVGITGPAGVGKSTLTAALTRSVRAEGRRAAILAVDPSSPRSGGALLGDRLRFGALAAAEGVFLRSLATRGETGGLSASVEISCRVLEAAGFDVVFIETVGVGQDEVEVADLADVVVVVQAPGLGDDVQAMKAGLLEIADVLVVNKADRDGAARAAAELQAMRRWTGATATPVLQTTATRGAGVDELWDVVRTLERARDAPEAARRALIRRAARMVERALRERWRRAEAPAASVDDESLRAEVLEALAGSVAPEGTR